MLESSETVAVNNSCTERCAGHFCHLINALHPTRDLLCPKEENSACDLGQSVAAIENSFISNEKEAKRSQQRERAACILRRLLSPKEWAKLEENASILQLRIREKVDPIKFGFISNESIQLAQKEHRLALSQLREAEEALTSGKLVLEESQKVSCLPVETDIVEERAVVETTKVAGSAINNAIDESKVRVCGVCHTVYQLLDRARYLILDKRREKEGNDVNVLKRKDHCKVESDCRLDLEGPYMHQPHHLKTNLRAEASHIDSDAANIPIPNLLREFSNHEKELTSSKALAASGSHQDSLKFSTGSFMKILLCVEDDATSKKARRILEKKGFVVYSIKEPSAGNKVSKSHSFDACVVSDYPACREYFAEWLRVKRDFHFSGAQFPIISVSSDASTTETKTSGQSCFTWNPILGDETLLMVVMKAISSRFNGDSFGSGAARFRSRRIRCNGDSASLDAVSSSKRKKDVSKAPKKQASQNDCTFRGLFRYDESTVFPFIVMCGPGSSACSANDKPVQCAISNLIVCHDIFDTQERMEIFLRPLVSKNPRMQVLLWNYPGQAFTEFLDEEVLNNELHVSHLNALLRHLEQDETGHFDTGLPFYILGYGNGASIAVLYAATYGQPNLQGLLLVNGITFADPNFISVLQQCRDVFSCCSEARPDLPAYFYARYLFSSQYLNQVSASLALNLHTAVHNPISLKGRIRLCHGALRHIDIRPKMAKIKKPVVFVHGKNSAIVKPEHVRAFSDAYKGDRSICTTINSIVNEGLNDIVVFSIEGGHDLFQEKKKTLSSIIEQLLVGYYEHRGQSSRLVDIECNDLNRKIGRGASFSKSCSDKESRVNVASHQASIQFTETATYDDGVDRIDQGRAAKSKSTLEERRENHTRKTKRTDVSMVVEHPKHATFVRSFSRDQHNPSIIKPRSSSFKKAAPKYPEVQEFMRWRVRKNRDRLKKMHRSALCIQIIARCMIARSILLKLMMHKSSIVIQRSFRGREGRKMHWAKRRDIALAMLLQQVLRRFLSRSVAWRERKRRKVQLNLAKRWRGKTVRSAFRQLLIHTSRFATKIQCFYRFNTAKNVKNRLWIARFSCIVLQRVCRGYIGRCKAWREHRKYLFSKSHSSGIDLARQMLTECRHKATEIQTEILLLNSEKKSYENQIANTLNEVGNFEQGVQKIEKEMHDICMLDIEATNTLSVTSKDEAREQKMRLDNQFSETLARISDRRDEVRRLQGKLEENERLLHGKYDELRKLERKLVVMLDAQQIELNNIRRYQGKSEGLFERAHNFEKRHDESSATDVNALKATPSTGPSEKERQEAVQLMDSTEAMMKFGLMGVSMSYLSSLNLMRSMKKVYADGTTPAVTPFESSTISSHHENAGKTSNSISSTNWKVQDVLEWLSSLGLGQYGDAFRDGAVDGGLLVNLTNDDLLNTLGVEHKLHRKKILLSIEQLKVRNGVSSPSVALTAPLDDALDMSSINESGSVEKLEQINGPESLRSHISIEKKLSPRIIAPILDIEVVFSWVRHQKFETLQNALKHIPDKKYDEKCTRLQFVEGVGTVYVGAYDRIKFTMNKTDQHGNTMLHVAAQNGNIKLAALLIRKGCNPNHQNRQGNTPGHFAMAYQFYQFATWFFDEGGGNDLILNCLGLGAYDGIAPK